MPETGFAARLAELPGCVTRSVVRQDPFYLDTITLVPRPGEPKEFDRGFGGLIRMNRGIYHA